MTAIDDAWVAAFSELSILERFKEHGFVDILAAELKVFKEPRNMAKIDHEKSLPEIFRTNALTLLSITNSEYRISDFNIFQSLPRWESPGIDIQILNKPEHLETLTFEGFTSEQQLINAASASGIFDSFCEQEVTPTVSGRKFTGSHSFSIDTKAGIVKHVNISGVQIELDVGLEGPSAFFVVEAKNHISNDFNNRQLYFPYRDWSERLSKPVIPIFMTFANDVFDLFRFEYAVKGNFSSGHVTKHKRYMFAHRLPKRSALIEAANKSVVKPLLHQFPFPQADAFESVIDLVSQMLEGRRSIDDIAIYFGFDPRQARYYCDAARYLGLVSQISEDGAIFYEATSLAAAVFEMPYEQKYQALAMKILEIESMAHVYIMWERTHLKPSLRDTCQILESSNDARDISGNTISRRAHTVLAWVSWIRKISEDN